MNGKLQKNIAESFRVQFENNCIILLLESFQLLKSSSRNLLESNENDITAQLVGFMKTNPKRYDLQISVNREEYLDSKEIFEGVQSADESLRIDLKYITWNSNAEYEYHMEAKNLEEINRKKIPSGTLIDALKLRKRYINTGIENFITGKYPKGCLIGYILGGDTSNIVNFINDLLRAENREKEILNKSIEHGCDFHYISNHINSKISSLKHFFLNFIEKNHSN